MSTDGTIARLPRLAARAASGVALALAVLLGLIEPATGEDVASGAGASAPAAPLAPIPASRAISNLAIITIEGEINAITAHSVRRRIEQSVAGGADGIVFEIDSPGGEVGAVTDICSAIKNASVNTIAWVHPKAYSGGAIIALACRRIVLAPGATMGDAGVIGGDPLGFSFLQGLKPTERAKGLSLVIAEVVDSARRNGYDENLVQSFASLGVELWLIRDNSTGEQWFVNEAEYRAIWGDEPPRGSPGVPSAGLGKLNEQSKEDGSWQDLSQLPRDAGATPVEAQPGHEFRPASPELDNWRIRDAVHQTVRQASARPAFSEADRTRFTLVEYVTDGNVLLTLKEAELKRYGLADPSTLIATDAELQRYVGATNISRLDQSWSENLVAFMTLGLSGLVVRGLLIIVFLMAMFVEMSMPGVGLPGMIALGALAGLVVPPMLIGAANWWMGAIIIGGVLLILLEIFVLPGFGVPGVIGLVMLFAGLVGSFAAPGQLFPGVGPGGAGELARAGSIVLLSLFVAGVGVYLFVKYTDRFPVVGKLVLADRQMMSDDESGSGLLAAMSPEPASAGALARGAVGITTTPLRPSGTAEFDDRLIDVVSEVGFIESGQRVRIVSVNEYRVGVEPVRETGTRPSGAGEA